MAIKKRKYKKKYRGVRYIAKVLQKYGGKKYKKYSDAIAKSKSVLSELESKGQKVKVSTVMGVVRTPRKPKEQPKLSKIFLEPQPYFFLASDYPNEIFKTSNEITFFSDLFNSGVDEIQGGEKPSYKKNFSGFVNYLNKQIKEREKAYDYRVMCTPLEYDKKNKRWVTKIIAIDPDGEETDFDYEPSPSLETGPDVSLEPSKKETEKAAPTTKSEKLKIKELELKITLEKSRQQANEMFLKGLYSKKEYKDRIEQINKLENE